MAASLDFYLWARDTIGESGGAVYRLHGKAGAPDLFLKHGAASVAGDITDEMARLLWLADHLPVPEVRHFVRTDDAAWLLITAMPGRTAFQCLEDDPGAADTIVDALAAFLRRLHAIPIDTCPFTSAHPHRLARARARIDAGLIDLDDFDEARAGWSAERVWDAMQALLPLAPDPVVTHGDFSLDNILMIDGAVAGLIDVGRVGIADRYQDLAILWNCLHEFGGGLPERLFDQYGIAAPDQAKLRFHLMLDELF
ncbi:APH(3')-I family aminoglycoside O-phosphotransferase [Sphingomonas naphthae]|uniref:Aminoglycoside 3'-phosphotransferase n=1 Tax=Sphingomonas naphthae TaxID=1813468 RepID=A0ABY7TRX0_9SPHN|nr:APH(3')-I family aminoglycoside O-phosphotransferase [Sphingomonas naphthae]WCT75446.1 APH(3')-I family aminoglycoside O-phosphotransferase [Sphingomonas naphthae]